MLRLALVVVGVLPLLAAALAWADVGAPLLSGIDAWFSLHCHRDPSRTLDVAGHRMPVCARCTGIYLGLLLGGAPPLARMAPRLFVPAALVGAALVLLDVGTEALGWRVPSLGTRLALGFAFALPAAALAVGPPEPRAKRS